MSTHKKISLIKSAVRIAGYVIGGYAFQYTNFFATVAFIILIGSEGLGIVEELGEK